MSMAPPGNNTGTYYIILGNIPKKKRGNDLKEFSQRSGYNVVHAQVHPNLGCGYVCVEGQNAFYQVGEYLGKQPWDGKNMQVDMRNEFNAVSLGPAAQAASSPLTRGGTIGQSPTSQNGNGMYSAIEIQHVNYRTQGQASAQTSPTYVMQNGFGQQYTYGNAAPSYSTAPAMQVNYATNRMTQVNTTQYQYGESSQYPPTLVQQQQTYAPVTYPAAAMQVTFQKPAAELERQTVSTSNLLLHLTRVSNCYTLDELEKRIAKVFGTKRSAVIEHAWIPSGTDKYALVLMKSEELAATVVQSLGLNGVKITGKDGKKRSLKAKLAQEGISEGELAALKAEKNGDSLATQVKKLSMNSTTQNKNGTSMMEEQSVKQAFDFTSAYTKENYEPASIARPGDDEIAGVSRRRSSLPIVNGSFPQPPRKAITEAEVLKDSKRSSSSKDKERSSRNGHKHGSSHHSSSNRTNGQVSSGSKKNRK